jgi:hypothetical protein
MANEAQPQEKLSNDCAPGNQVADLPPPSFSYRGSQVRIVSSYTYLGIWFTSNLTWGNHIDYMIHNATDRTKNMRALLTTCGSRYAPSS